MARQAAVRGQRRDRSGIGCGLESVTAKAETLSSGETEWT